MSRYSSESESSRGEESYRRKKHSGRTRGRSRSSSLSSSDSHYSSKKRSYKHKRSKGQRSRSRDKYSKSRSRHLKAGDEGSRSSLRSRSSSKVKNIKSSKDRSRSSSGDRSRSRGCGRSRKRSRSKGRNHTHSRSSSRGRSRSSPQSSPDSRTHSLPGAARQEPSSEEQLHAKLQKAIRAAQSADDQLRQQGLLTGTSSRKDDMAREPSSSIIDEINSQSFVQKQFTSSRSSEKLSQDAPVVIDLTTEGTQNSAPKKAVVEDSGSIFHSSLFGNPEQKLDKWVKRLFHLRQKAINGEPIT